jgi:N-methylhydantoinase A
VRKLRVAVDIGGTFTDLIAYDEETRKLIAVKTPSTPPGFIQGVMNALDKAQIRPEEIVDFKHGSTIATNAIIERRGAKTGLITTKGMRDVLLAGRANRPDLFNSNWDPSPPLIQRRHILEADERVDYEGAVLTALNEDDVRAAARKFRARRIESIAVSYLNSFMRTEHELRTKEILQEELGAGVFVSTSAEILPEIREFERTSTVAANAYLAPVIETYLDALQHALRAWGYDGEVFVTHSGGGVMTARAAREVPARICHSGPAGGVIGGMEVGKLAGFVNVITFDMGGTSADLSLVEACTPTLASEWRVDWNIPILFPAIDLVAIGAGGGTIAWVDAGGSLRCGPQSAGADPGPAALGKGNDRPTITDAQLYLGRLNPETYLGGDLAIDPALAADAITRLSEALGIGVTETAAGIVRIANANMTSATHLISVERGYDPREFAFVAGGGGGPLHAADIAEELGIPQVIIAPNAGLASAVGILQVDVRHDFLSPVMRQAAQLESGELVATFDRLVADAQAALDGEQIPEDRRAIELSVDVRYYGQTPYVNIKLPAPPSDADGIGQLVERYGETYEREFGYRLPSEVASVEIVNARVGAVGLTDRAEFPEFDEQGDAAEAKRGERDVYFHQLDGFTTTPVYDRASLRAGASFDGPAIVEQDDTTVLAPPGWRVRVDRRRNLILEAAR